VDGTRALLALAAQHGATRFVYTSSIECTYAYNRSVQADEEHPYSAHPTNSYQRTKVAAERLVLEANSAKMATVSVRPAHIVGDPLEDDLPSLLDMDFPEEPQIVEEIETELE
jgi:nucleoside-diphosphate-sugar epimerase